MDTPTLDAARSALVAARQGARALASWPAEWRLSDVDAAYRLQSAVESRLHTMNGDEPEDGVDERDMTALGSEEVGLHLDDPAERVRVRLGRVDHRPARRCHPPLGLEPDDTLLVGPRPAAARLASDESRSIGGALS